MFVNEFSGTSKPGNLKVCIPFEFSVLEYQLPPAYRSFYLFIFFSPINHSGFYLNLSLQSLYTLEGRPSLFIQKKLCLNSLLRFAFFPFSISLFNDMHLDVFQIFLENYFTSDFEIIQMYMITSYIV